MKRSDSQSSLWAATIAGIASAAIENQLKLCLLHQEEVFLEQE